MQHTKALLVILGGQSGDFGEAKLVDDIVDSESECFDFEKFETCSSSGVNNELLGFGGQGFLETDRRQSGSLLVSKSGQVALD